MRGPGQYTRMYMTKYTCVYDISIVTTIVTVISIIISIILISSIIIITRAIEFFWCVRRLQCLLLFDLRTYRF